MLRCNYGLCRAGHGRLIKTAPKDAVKMAEGVIVTKGTPVPPPKPLHGCSLTTMKAPGLTSVQHLNGHQSHRHARRLTVPSL
jgi:hypothetical protein